MTSPLGRPLAVIGLGVVAAVLVMAVLGWAISATGHSQGRQQFSVTVINDSGERVTIQPCGRFFCSTFPSVDLAAGGSHTWRTNDGDTGVYSFVVEVAPGGRILGCLARHGVASMADRAEVSVTDLERCVS